MAPSWEDFQKWMERQQLPGGFEQLFRQSEWVESYVRKMISKTMPAAESVFTESVFVSSGPTIKETRHYLIITMKLTEGADVSSLRLSVWEDRLKMHCPPEMKSRLVKLPKPVMPRSCEARCSGAVLRIKLRKRPRKRRPFEAYIFFE